MAKPILELRNLTTVFPTRRGEVRAVDAVNLALYPGQILGLVGESGCGKSTVLLSILGLIARPGRITGEVLFDGHDLTKLSNRELRQVRGKEIAMIFQDPLSTLNPAFPVGEQIRESLRLHNMLPGPSFWPLDSGRRRREKERVLQVMEEVGIPAPEARYRAYPHQFSGGMQQRALIAIAVSCRPKVLLADEPTTALDVTIQAQILDLVRDLKQRIGMAIIWITHDLGIVAGLADRVLVMYAGYIIESAPVKDIYADPRHPYTLGLLGSIPRLDAERKKKLTPIEGLPPDLIDPPPGCPFAPRCRFAIEQCLAENPTLQPVALNHHVACWVDTKRGVA